MKTTLQLLYERDGLVQARREKDESRQRGLEELVAQGRRWKETPRPPAPCDPNPDLEVHG